MISLNISKDGGTQTKAPLSIQRNSSEYTPDLMDADNWRRDNPAGTTKGTSVSALFTPSH